MPVLVVLSVGIAVYSVTRPGALAGVKYFLVPNPANFSWMTVVSAMGQMFYSLSIAMGILVTFGSYMKKNVSIEQSTENVEIFDTAIAIMAGLMIIPAVFAFSGGDPDTLQAGPALMFITIPKVFASMGMGTAVGVLFFVLVLFAALTSSIALTESAVSTFEDELGWDRTRSTILIGQPFRAGRRPPCQCDRVRDAVPRFLRLPDQLGDDAHCGHCHLPAGLPDRRCGKDRGRGHAGRSALPPQTGVQLYAPVSLPHLRGHHPGQLGRQRTGLDRNVTLFSARKKPPACILTGRGLFDHSFSNTRKRNAMSVVSSGRAARRAAPSRGVFQ